MIFQGCLVRRDGQTLHSTPILGTAGLAYVKEQALNPKPHSRKPQKTGSQTASCPGSGRRLTQGRTIALTEIGVESSMEHPAS